MTVADFYTDVEDSTNSTAEDIAYEVLQSHFAERGIEIRDVRDAHLKWDFIIVRDGQEFHLDVKCDKYIERTGRFAFEMFHIHNSGDVQPSWGLNEQLTYIAVVPASFKYVRIVPLLYVRSYVALMQKLHPVETLIEHRGWKEIQVQNRARQSGWTTYGWAVPMDGIEKYCELAAAKIITLPTPETVHRKESRIFLGGKEVAA